MNTERNFSSSSFEKKHFSPGSWMTLPDLHKTCRWFVMVLAVLLATGHHALAQFESASVLGYVHDNSGAAIPNANVTLTNVATGIKQTKPTDGEGKYEFPSIQPGNYQITGEAQGFSGTRTETFAVQTNARQRVDVSLKPGSVSEEVTVSSAAQLLDTWADTLRAKGLEVSVEIVDNQSENVLLQKTQESSVGCIFVDPHYAEDNVDASGLSANVKALILGAQCSVEVVRANGSSDQYLKPAA